MQTCKSEFYSNGLSGKKGAFTGSWHKAYVTQKVILLLDDTQLGMFLFINQLYNMHLITDKLKKYVELTLLLYLVTSKNIIIFAYT